MKTYQIVAMVCAAYCGSIFLALSHERAFGSRGVRDEGLPPFDYRGKPAVLRQEDCRWAGDRFWVLADGKRLTGKFLMNDGRVLHVTEDSYEIEAARGSREE